MELENLTFEHEHFTLEQKCLTFDHENFTFDLQNFTFEHESFQFELESLRFEPVCCHLVNSRIAFLHRYLWFIDKYLQLQH